MNKNKGTRGYSLLVLAFTAMILLLSSVCVFADSSVRITSPEDGSTVEPGEVSVWTSFAQPPVMSGVAVTEGRASYIKSEYGISYTPVKFIVYKDGAFLTEKDVDQEWLNFTNEGSKSTSFLFEDEGSYTISASVPHTQYEWDSVTIKVEGEYDGTDYASGSFSSENAPVLAEGKAGRCVLTKDNSFTAVYKLTPAESGRYIFFSAGAAKQIRGSLYEGIGDTYYLDSVSNGEASSEDGQFVFSVSLTAGTPYTLLVQGYVKKKDTVFDVGFIRKDSGAMMASASSVTLTDTENYYSVSVGSGSPIPDGAEWYSSDTTVVWIPGRGTSSRGNPETYAGYYNTNHATLQARGSGTAVVTFENKETNQVFASCRITCTGMPAFDPCSKGHRLTKTEARPATVTAEGNTAYWTCERCGKLFSDEEGKTETDKSKTVIPKLKEAETPAETQPTTPAAQPAAPQETQSAAPPAAQPTTPPAAQPTTPAETPQETPTEAQPADIPQTPGGDTPAGYTDKTAADGTSLGAGASAEAAEAAITGMKTDKDLPGSVFRGLQLTSGKQTKTSITISWKKVSGAVKYVIYGNKCGKTDRMKKLATVSGKTKKFTKVAGKKVKKGTWYKFQVVALNKNSKVVSSSKIIYVVSKGGKAGNVKSVSTKAKKNSVSLKKGKTFKLAAKAVPESKKLNVKQYRAVSYESSNTGIASVSSKGVIKARKKGTCYVYAYAQNGVFAKIKVVVR